MGNPTLRLSKVLCFSINFTKVMNDLTGSGDPNHADHVIGHLVSSILSVNCLVGEMSRFPAQQ